MKFFRIIRLADPTGISGTGKIASGCELSNGECLVNWHTEHSSRVHWLNRASILEVHGKVGRTIIQDITADQVTDADWKALVMAQELLQSFSSRLYNELANELAPERLKELRTVCRLEKAQDLGVNLL
jgi:hypothetical protein